MGTVTSLTFVTEFLVKFGKFAAPLCAFITPSGDVGGQCDKFEYGLGKVVGTLYLS